MIAVARVSVNHDGESGTALDPLVWLLGLMLHLPNPPVFLNSSWFQVAAGRITGGDIAAWPYSASILIRFTSFLNTLHWPSGSDDVGHFGISFLELFSFLAMGWSSVAQ